MYIQYLTHIFTPIIFWKRADYSESLPGSCERVYEHMYIQYLTHMYIHQLSFRTELTTVGLFSQFLDVPVIRSWSPRDFSLQYQKSICIHVYTISNIHIYTNCLLGKSCLLWGFFFRLVMKLEGDKLPLLHLPLLPPPHHYQYHHDPVPAKNIHEQN